MITRWAAVLALSGCSSILGIEDFQVSGDGGGDGTPMGFCLGPGDWRVCLPSAPTKPFNFTSAGTIGADFVGPCEPAQPAGWTDKQPPACFVTATDITISATLKAEGARPLVLFASKSIKITAAIDLAGHRGATAMPAGANPATCTPPTAPVNGGGGAGGSFTTAGGNGGRGTPSSSTAGVAAGPAARPARLRGGCPGGLGGAVSGVNGGVPGIGGGAIYLVAGERIEVDNTFINVSGAPGDGSLSPTGGGGGGTGGMIVLFAPSIGGIGGNLVANGGGGGGGGGGGVIGQPGGEPSPGDPTMIPPGGPGGSIAGQGGAGFPATGGMLTGTNAAIGGAAGGGGGGGGGAGFIMMSTPAFVTSPAVAAFP